jgi:hypothetical protein
MNTEPQKRQRDAVYMREAQRRHRAGLSAKMAEVMALLEDVRLELRLCREMRQQEPPKKNGADHE